MMDCWARPVAWLIRPRSVTEAGCPAGFRHLIRRFREPGGEGGFGPAFPGRDGNPLCQRVWFVDGGAEVAVAKREPCALGVDALM